MTWLIEGDDLAAFYRAIGGDVPVGVYAVRVHCDDAGVRIQVNEAAWTPDLGVSE